MNRGALKAVGERGSWFAKVDGDRLPCVHKHWVTGTTHVDPNYDGSDPKFIELVEAIRRGKRVILTNDIAITNAEKKSGIGFERTGYIAIFDVDDLSTGPEGLRFELRKRVCDLK
jgi:hypothetical protein